MFARYDCGCVYLLLDGGLNIALSGCTGKHRTVLPFFGCLPRHLEGKSPSALEQADVEKFCGETRELVRRGEEFNIALELIEMRRKSGGGEDVR